MDALLGNLGMGGFGDAPRGSENCTTVEDLQDQLRSLLAAKCTETRAEHVSTTFQFGYGTTFHLVIDQEVPEGADPVEHLQQLPTVTRTVNASETVLNQPSDDPALQKNVCKHIIAALGTADGCSWLVRQVVRGAQGWSFTYHCSQSLATWNRQNAKNPERPLMAGYSGPGGLDPINLSRPSFECRGSVNIAFSKSSRAIVVKYEHTPMHLTVSQLVERLAPVLPPPPVVNGKANGNGKSKRSAKAKRPPPADGEEAPRKRRGRKKKNANGDGNGSADVETPTEATAQPPPGAVHATSILNVPPQEAARRREVALKQLTDKGIDPVTLSAEQFNIFANQAPHLQELSLDMLVKYGAERLRIVHPDEKEAASNSSTPATQGNGENATPNTAKSAASAPGASGTPSKKRGPRQRKSKAAAPDTTDGGTASTPARITRGACENCKQKKVKCPKEHPSCSVCTDAGDECRYKLAKPKPRKSVKSAETIDQDDSDMPVVDSAQRSPDGHEAEPPQDAYAPAAQQTQYEYPQVEQRTHDGYHQDEQQPPEEYVQPEYPVPNSDPVQEQHLRSSGRQQQPSAQVAQMDPDNDEFIPDPNILSGPIELPPAEPQQPATNYVAYQQSHSAGLTQPQTTALPQTTTLPQTPALPQTTATEPSAPKNTTATGLTFPQTSQSTSGLTFPSGGLTTQQVPPAHSPPVSFPSGGQATQQVQQTQRVQSPTVAYSSVEQATHPVQRTQSPNVTFSQQASTAQQSQPSRSTPSNNGTRRSLPTAQGSRGEPASGSQGVSRTSNWGGMAHSGLTGQNRTQSPTQPQQQAARRPKSRKSAAEVSPQVPSPHMYNAAIALSQAAMQQSSRAPQTNQSPFASSGQKPSARTKSRQGHRSQSSTPVAHGSVPPPLPAATHHTASTSYNAAPTSATPSSGQTYDPYSRYNTSTSDQYSGGNDQPSSRATYEANTYNVQPTTAPAASYTAPSYDYPRTTGATNPLSQALSTSNAYVNPGSSNGDPWSSSQTRGAQASTMSSSTANPYSAHTSSPQAYGRNSSRAQAPASTSYTPQAPAQPQPPQQHQQAYSSYSSQQPSTSQQSQNWYGFPAGNTTTPTNNSASYSSSARGSGYGAGAGHSGAYQSQRYSGYGGADDLYDLLRGGHQPGNQ